MEVISNSKIKNISSIIRKCYADKIDIEEETLNHLQKYRISHQESLYTSFEFLVNKTKYHYSGGLVVYRLKRIDTIIRKIQRHKNMGMLTMQDIAGCRAIVGSINQIRKIVLEFDNDPNFEVISRDDYISTPRETGYSSYHLIVRPKNQIRVVEIQLRTRKHHSWATFVEITDLIYNVKLKEGQEHPELYEFHKILSKEKSLITIDDKIRLHQIESNLEVVKKVSSLFNSNYLFALERWINAQPENESKYLIMELDEKLSPNFTFYNSFIEAEKKYFLKFTKDEPNMVLIHTDDLQINKLELAYSNYILTSHPAIKFYLEQIRDLIIDYKSDKKDHYNLYKYYSDIINSLLDNFNNEIVFISDFMSKKNNSSSHKMINNWYENLVNRTDEFKKGDSEFKKLFNSIEIPIILTKRKPFSFSRIVKHILNK